MFFFDGVAAPACSEDIRKKKNRRNDQKLYKRLICQLIYLSKASHWNISSAQPNVQRLPLLTIWLAYNFQPRIKLKIRNNTKVKSKFRRNLKTPRRSQRVGTSKEERSVNWDSKWNILFSWRVFAELSTSQAIKDLEEFFPTPYLKLRNYHLLLDDQLLNINHQRVQLVNLA